MTLEEELIKALLNLYKSCPPYLPCNSFHHKRQDRHEYDEPCPLEINYENAMKEANRLLYYNL
jgi:hypothetical protein